MIDLNRIFPGDPDGLLTHQLASRIYGVFADACEYFVDFHCGGILPTVDYVYLHGDEGLARSIGSRLIYTGASYDGSLAYCLEKAGKKTTVIELGGGRVSSVPGTERALTALTRVLKYAGCLEGKVEERSDQIVLDTMRIIRPHHGGMLLSELSLSQLGSLLAKDTVVGRIVNPQILRPSRSSERHSSRRRSYSQEKVSRPLASATTGSCSAARRRSEAGLYRPRSAHAEPEWGDRLGSGLQYFGQSWWLKVFPALAGMICASGIAVLGKGVAGFARISGKLDGDDERGERRLGS